jgi:hypothetical protein
VVDASKQMIGGNVIFETEGMKQRLLVATLPTHHAERLRLPRQSFGLAQRFTVPEFFNRIGQERFVDVVTGFIRDRAFARSEKKLGA